MGNCQAAQHDAVLFRNDARFRNGAKKDPEDDTFHQSSALTLPMMSSLSLVPESPSNSAATCDALDVISERARPITHSPKPRLSVETSLRLRTADEEELGAIRYHFTCLNDARKGAQQSQKPILCIEVEVPGDVRVGREVLSHPLIVEAAETLFVSVAPIEYRRRTDPINVAGKHCYTRVRMLDHDGVDLIMPVWGKLLCLAKVVSAMVEALNAVHQQVPTYLQLLHEEECGRTREGPVGCLRRTDRQAVFGMPCSRRGEVEYAGLDGVLATRAGCYDRQNVVQVTYDTSRLSYCNLVRHGLQRNVASVIFYQTNEERVAGKMEVERRDSKVTLVKFFGAIQPNVEPKHALRKTMLRFVPLTDLQSTRANRLVEMGTFNEAMHLLSPRQGQLLMRSLHNPTRKEVVDVPITAAWKSISEDQMKLTSQ